MPSFNIGDTIRCSKSPDRKGKKRGAGWEPGYTFTITKITNDIDGTKIYWMGADKCGVYEYEVEEGDWDG